MPPQIHEPVLATGKAPELRAVVNNAYAALAAANVPLHLVIPYDDMAEEVYEWVLQLPVAAVGLDFCGVPGAAHGNCTAQLVAKCGFPKVSAVAARSTFPCYVIAARCHLTLPFSTPLILLQDKRLGAGVIDGRSVWADDGTAGRLVAALRARLGPDQAICVQVS